MRSPGDHKRTLLALSIAAAVMLVLGVLAFRGDVAHGDRLDQDPEIYLPLVMKSYCSDWWQDDFSDPNSGWPVSDTEYWKVEYLSGELHTWLKVPQAMISFSTWPPVYATDFILEVDGRGDWGYGLVFGAHPTESEWYRFTLWWWREWGIYKHDSAHPWGVLLDSGSSSYITTDMNRLKIVRQGSQIEAYANDHLLTTFVDDSFLGSRIVGLTAGSGTGDSHAYFDNFAVCPVDSAPGVGAADAPGMGEAIILQKGTAPIIEFWPR